MKPARTQVVCLLSITFILFASLLLGGCGSTGGSTGGSSNVTLTIGGLSANGAAAGRAAPRAIPASIATVTITVNGPGMAEIVKTVVVAGRATVVETLSVPKGLQRTFTITAVDANGTVRFQGVQTVDVLGDSLTLSIPLSVSPTNPALGRWNWRNPLPTGAELRAVSFGNGVFVAVGVNGTALRSIDNGATWTQHNTGAAESLSAVAISGSTVVATGEFGAIVRSTDGGVTWTDVTPPESSADFTGVAGHGATFVAVAYNGTILASTDGGATWTAANAGATNGISGVAWGNGYFVATGGQLLRSATGTGSWENVTTVEMFYFGTIAFGNNQFVAIDGNGGGVVSNDNGATWSPLYGAETSSLNALAYGDNVFASVGYFGNSIWVDVTSSWWGGDGVYQGWNYGEGLSNEFLNGIAFGNHTFVAVGSSGAIVRTPNPSGWSTVTTGITPHGLRGIAYANGTFVAVGYQGDSSTGPAFAARSTNGGASWEFGGTVPYANLADVAFGAVGGDGAYGGGGFVAVGGSGLIVRSVDDGQSWSYMSSFQENEFTGVAFGNGTFVAAGSGGSLRRWNDGAGNAWQYVTPEVASAESFTGVAFGNGTFMAVTYSGMVLVSTDNGATWDTRDNPSAGAASVAFGNGAFVVVDDSGATQYSTDNGTTWTAGGTIQGVGGDASLQKLTYGGGLFLVVSGNNIHASPDGGRNWTTSYMPIWASGSAYGNGTVVVVGSNGQIIQSDPL